MSTFILEDNDNPHDDDDNDDDALEIAFDFMESHDGSLWEH